MVRKWKRNDSKLDLLNMYYTILVMLLFVGNILPSSLDNYKLIIIPIPKSLLSRTNYIVPSKKSINHIEKPDKLDFALEETTEAPKLNYFVYTKDKGETKSDEENINVNREDVIRYLIQRTDQESKRFKHNTEDGIAVLRGEENEPNFDYDPLYGENKIVGGLEVDINLYPYHAAYGSNCGGAIIDKKWVITAGHCGKKPYVKVGSKYMNQGTKVAVKHNYIHPQWSGTKEHPFDFDFQLLELAEALKLGENIQPVKLAHIEDMVIGKHIDVTGWGNTKENGPYSNILRAVRVPIIAKEHCQHVPFPYFKGALTPRMFCAGFSEGKKDACQGDSGGPAVSSDRLLGMVSFGYGCATPGSYGVYSKVATVRPWVEEVTGIKLD